MHGLSIRLALCHGYACISGNFRMGSWSIIPPSHCSGTDLPSLGSVSASWFGSGWLAEQGEERSHTTIPQLEGLTFTGTRREFSLRPSSLHSSLVLQPLLRITDPTHQVSTLLRCISRWILMNQGSRRLKHLAMTHSTLPTGMRSCIKLGTVMADQYQSKEKFKRATHHKF